MDLIFNPMTNAFVSCFGKLFYCVVPVHDLLPGKLFYFVVPGRASQHGIFACSTSYTIFWQYFSSV